jgi:energy-coupling factor transporter ATP-binding protein EcfA2|tara:strand:+ start:282 stop:653 length:372 start_codon:yes stop_codon:yes gene_type:complete
MKILICGPEGSGKTTLAKPFAELIGGVYINKDSYQKELRGYVDGIVAAGKSVVIDKRCNTPEAVDYLDPDYVVWLDMRTVKTERPNRVDYHIEGWFDNTPEQLSKVVERYITVTAGKEWNSND